MALPLYEKQSNRFPYKAIFFPPVKLLFKNLLFSFIPPFFSRFNKVALDLVGPASSLLLITVILNVTNYYKPNKSLIKIGPIQYMIYFSLILFSMSYIMCKLIGRSRLLLCEVVSLLGYYLYSHVLTLVLAVLFARDDEKDFFYIMILCISASTFRVVMILSRSMRIPAMRFVVTTFVVTLLILNLIWQYFAFVHPTFL